MSVGETVVVVMFPPGWSRERVESDVLSVLGCRAGDSYVGEVSLEFVDGTTERRCQVYVQGDPVNPRSFASVVRERLSSVFDRWNPRLEYGVVGPVERYVPFDAEAR